ncbi:threonine synthase-like 2 isoform 3-T3 [Pholidichthys leucotaenia]
MTSSSHEGVSQFIGVGERLQVSMMNYCSTRGGVCGWDFKDVLFSGYAPDGGMFMPEDIPVLSPDTLRSWKGLSYTQVVVEVAALFVSTQLIPRGDLEGTSGDTGGSAIQNAKGLPGLDVVVVYPQGRITPVQEKHMTSCMEDNVHVFAADGSSDDIDQPLRRLFADQELVKSHGLMSLNSVNWSRVMIQLAHFIYAYLELSGMEQNESTAALPEMEVVVPTGGAGNIAAGYIVKQMGLPLKLVAMVNSNDIVHRTVIAGDFSMAANVTQTLASAIDIQDPYNMERVFWLLLGKDGAAVKAMMEEFQHSHRHLLPENHRRLLSQVLSTGSVSDEGILETMRRVWEENQYMLCPHSAVAVWHHYHCSHNPGINRCYVATASPAKFQAAVEKAGLTFDLPEAVLVLEKLPTRYQNLERSQNWCKDWEDRLREHIQSVGRARTRETYYS